MDKPFLLRLLKGRLHIDEVRISFSQQMPQELLLFAVAQPNGRIACADETHGSRKKVKYHLVSGCFAVSWSMCRHLYHLSSFYTEKPMITVLPNQTLLDIAIQEYGTAEAVFLLAQENRISPTERLNAGMVLKRPDVIKNKDMENYCKSNRVSPATLENSQSDITLRIFTEEFTEQFM